jgi:hypothetical protein
VQYRSFSWPRRPLRCLAKSPHAHWVVGEWEPFHRPFEMVLIYQRPNAHVRISWILLRNAMAAAAVKKIY